MMVRMRQRAASPRSWVALGAAGVLLVSACGGDAEPRVDAAEHTSPAPTTTAAPTTSSARSTTTTTSAATTATSSTTSTTSTSTSSTTSTTTTVVTEATFLSGLAEPIPPPLDTYAAEPVIELGRIQIPKIGVDMTMYEGIRLTTLDHGPGHWPGSAMPGQPGNVVVGGHRVSTHRVFRNVDQLAPGDQIIFVDGSDTYVYAVSRVEVVQPDAVWIIDPTPTPTATLFACHPPGSTAQRIVVFADLVD